jgi:hypothetical protein
MSMRERARFAGAQITQRRNHKRIGAGFNRSRRAALAVLAVALWAPGVAHAQDPRAALVQKAARDWLALADTLDAQATWRAAGTKFHESIPLPRWTAGLKRERDARGSVVQRAVEGTTLGPFPDQPDSDNIAIVRFRTSFSKESLAIERVTLELGPDKVWRVVGYVIR